MDLPGCRGLGDTPRASQRAFFHHRPVCPHRACTTPASTAYTLWLLRAPSRFSIVFMRKRLWRCLTTCPSAAPPWRPSRNQRLRARSARRSGLLRASRLSPPRELKPQTVSPRCRPQVCFAASLHLVPTLAQVLSLRTLPAVSPEAPQPRTLRVLFPSEELASELELLTRRLGVSFRAALRRWRLLQQRALRPLWTTWIGILPGLSPGTCVSPSQSCRRRPVARLRAEPRLEPVFGRLSRDREASRRSAPEWSSTWTTSTRSTTACRTLSGPSFEAHRVFSSCLVDVPVCPVMSVVVKFEYQHHVTFVLVLVLTSHVDRHNLNICN